MSFFVQWKQNLSSVILSKMFCMMEYKYLLVQQQEKSSHFFNNTGRSDLF